MCEENKENKENKNHVKVKVAAVQFVPILEDIDANIQKTLNLLDSLEKCDIAILPEYWSTSWCYSCMDYLSPRTHGSLEILKNWCKAKKTWLVCGTLPFKTERGIFNRTYILDDGGEEVVFYDKMHLFAQGGEAEVFITGDTPVLFDAFNTTFGVTVCHDLRFPEYYTKLVMYGAKIILCPSMWPTARLEAWEILARARAMDNQVFFIGVNGTGSSLAAGPKGEIIKKLSTEEGTFSVEINLNEIEKTRSKMNLRKTRRPDIYGFAEEKI